MNDQDGASAPFSVVAGSSVRVWRAGRFRIDLSRPKVMGIVNLTPDSFSGGGAPKGVREALAHCERLLQDGADLLDLGAESTRPQATPVPAAEEWARLAEVLGGALALGCAVSVDTHKAEVMRRALDAGADIVNDVHALQGDGALDVVAGHDTCGVCLMHSIGTPGSRMPPAPLYEDVVAEVRDYLAGRDALLRRRGIAAERIVLDPGIGFSKRPEHNLQLLRRQAELDAVGRPLLVGWSRKSTLGIVTGRSVGGREAASVAAALAAVQRGAAVVRVHDVAATVDALRVWEAAGLGAR